MIYDCSHSWGLAEDYRNYYVSIPMFSHLLGGCSEQITKWGSLCSTMQNSDFKSHLLPPSLIWSIAHFRCGVERMGE